MSGIGRLRESSPRAGMRLWLRPEVESAWSQGLPLAGTELESSGRGALLRVDSALGPALVRTYRRGGALAGLFPDAFFGAARALRELEASERLEPLGVAPAVLGLEITGSLLHRMRIAVAEVPAARNLLELGAASSPALRMPALGRAIGRAVAAMHAAGVSHPDLNVANVLVADEGVRLIDFDGARLEEGAIGLARRRREVQRLCRSLDKWQVTAATPASLRSAFLRAVLPAGERRAMLVAGRRQHRRRAARGRVSRPWPERS